MTMMKAVIAPEPGGPEALQLVDRLGRRRLRARSSSRCRRPASTAPT